MLVNGSYLGYLYGIFTESQSKIKWRTDSKCAPYLVIILGYFSSFSIKTHGVIPDSCLLILDKGGNGGNGQMARLLFSYIVKQLKPSK